MINPLSLDRLGFVQKLNQGGQTFSAAKGQGGANQGSDDVAHGIFVAP